MHAAQTIVGLLWAVFVVCWLVLALFNKKASRTPWRAPWAVRLVVLVGVLAVVLRRRHGVPDPLFSIGHALALRPGAGAQWAGVGLCLVGFGLAFWARMYLGRNWGMPMSMRQGHELVTTGPYAYIRHPIYSGLMLAMIGSALTIGVVWLLMFVLYIAYFMFSARTEERMMLAQFPDAYPAYRRRTKMLIPFVF